MPINSLSSKSDAELAFMASVNDDQEAFACLFGRFNAMIHAKAVEKSRLCGSDITDDLAQEAAIGFLNAVRSYDPSKGASFRTYAERCVDNILGSAIRTYLSGKNSLLNEHLQYDAVNLSDDLIVSTPDEFAMSVLAGLSDLEKSVVDMRLRDMSYEETAKALGISVKSVDNAIQRVRQKFKSLKKN